MISDRGLKKIENFKINWDIVNKVFRKPDLSLHCEICDKKISNSMYKKYKKCFTCKKNQVKIDKIKEKEQKRIKKQELKEQEYIEKVKERFEIRVDKNGPNGCWIWLGGTRGNAKYGTAFFHGRKVFAHRLSAFLYKGEPLEWKGYGDLIQMHSCDNPRCVNPKHLTRDTHMANMKDMYSKGRNPPIYKLNKDQQQLLIKEYLEGKSCPQLAKDFNIDKQTIYKYLKRNKIQVELRKGWKTKINLEIAREIRKKFATQQYSKAQLGREYGVGHNCIGRIISNETWKENKEF